MNLIHFFHNSLLIFYFYMLVHSQVIHSFFHSLIILSFIYFVFILYTCKVYIQIASQTASRQGQPKIFRDLKREP